MTDLTRIYKNVDLNYVKMILDRLAEFQERKADLKNVREDDNGTVIEIQMDGADEMENFFQEVQHLRRLIQELGANVRNAETLQSEILSTPILNVAKLKELDSVRCRVDEIYPSIQSTLQQMEKRNHQEKLTNQSFSSSASLRIRKTQYSSLFRDYVEVINEYERVQLVYRDRCKDRIKRQLEIVDHSLTDEQVELMIKEGNFTVFTQGILLETEQAKKTLAALTDRYDEIIKLEKSLTELHALFKEIALLIQRQGEVVNRTVDEISSAVHYTGRALEKIKEAEVEQRKSRKKQIWISGFLIISGLILFMIIYYSIFHKSK